MVSLSRRVSVWEGGGLSGRPPTVWLHVGGTHPAGVHSFWKTSAASLWWYIVAIFLVLWCIISYICKSHQQFWLHKHVLKANYCYCSNDFAITTAGCGIILDPDWVQTQVTQLPEYLVSIVTFMLTKYMRDRWVGRQILRGRSTCTHCTNTYSWMTVVLLLNVRKKDPQGSIGKRDLKLIN